MAASKVILITGANRGIGLAITSLLATHSSLARSTILLGSRTPSAGEEAITTLQRDHAVKARLQVLPLDITSDASLLAAVAHIKDTYGHLDILINNAGIAVASPPVLAPTDSNNTVDEAAAAASAYRTAWSSTLATNVTAVALTTTLFLPLLRRRASSSSSSSSSSAGSTSDILRSARSQVINVSSARGSLTRAATGQLPPSRAMAYDASKAALNMLTVDFARLELEVQKEEEEEGNKGEQEEGEGDAKVEFHSVNPGHCRTEFNGFRGLREPVEGARVVLELVLRGGEEKGRGDDGSPGVEAGFGFWETVGPDPTLQIVPW